MLLLNCRITACQALQIELDRSLDLTAAAHFEARGLLPSIYTEVTIPNATTARIGAGMKGSPSPTVRNVIESGCATGNPSAILATHRPKSHSREWHVKLPDALEAAALALSSA